MLHRQQKVDVTITTLRSGVVRVEDAEESLYASIDLVCDKVNQQEHRQQPGIRKDTQRPSVGALQTALSCCHRCRAAYGCWILPVSISS